MDNSPRGTNAPPSRPRAVAGTSRLHVAADARTGVNDERTRCMKRLFGAKKAPAAPAKTLSETATGLEQRTHALDAKITALDRELATHRDAIKRARPGAGQDAAKRRALVVLKQRKLYEQQREQLYGQRFNVEQVAFASEQAKETVETVRAMQSASKELKSAFKSPAFDLNEIDKLNDDMADLLDLGEEVQNTLGRSYNVPDDLDEDDLLDELDALELDMLDEETELAGSVPSYLQDEPLPAAPEGAPVVLPEAGMTPAEAAAGAKEEIRSTA